MANQLWIRRGKPFSKKLENYHYRSGDLDYLRKQAENMLYDPFLPFVLANCKRDCLPHVIRPKNKKMSPCTSILVNQSLVIRIILLCQSGYSAEFIAANLNMEPFNGEITIELIENFIHFFWTIPLDQRKLADEALLNIKPRPNLIQLYQLQLKHIIDVETLVSHITRKPPIRFIKNNMLNSLMYEMDRFPTYLTGHDPEDSELKINQLFTMSKTLKTLTTIPDD